MQAAFLRALSQWCGKGKGWGAIIETPEESWHEPPEKADRIAEQNGLDDFDPDAPSIFYGRNVQVGDNEEDVLNGGNGADGLFGFGQSDVLRGYAGDDLLDGGTNDDTLIGAVLIARSGAPDLD